MSDEVKVDPEKWYIRDRKTGKVNPQYPYEYRYDAGHIAAEMNWWETDKKWQNRRYVVVQGSEISENGQDE